MGKYTADIQTILIGNINNFKPEKEKIMENIVVYIDETRMVGEVEEIDLNSANFETQGGKEYILFTNSEDAGQSARDYWEDMAEYDSSEFTCMVGEKTLIAWALGKFAGPGYTQVNSLDDWLNLWLNTPEEHYASYDSQECIFVSKHPDTNRYTVAYRTN